MLQIPSKMKGSNSKMLQIPLNGSFQLHYKFHQNVANSMENERFQLQNVAKTVEMAASSSKMLQIASKQAEKQIQTKNPKTGKTQNSQNNSRPIINLDWEWSITEFTALLRITPSVIGCDTTWSYPACISSSLLSVQAKYRSISTTQEIKWLIIMFLLEVP